VRAYRHSLQSTTRDAAAMFFCGRPDRGFRVGVEPGSRQRCICIFEVPWLYELASSMGYYTENEGPCAGSAGESERGGLGAVWCLESACRHPTPCPMALLRRTIAALSSLRRPTLCVTIIARTPIGTGATTGLSSTQMQLDRDY